MEVFREVELRNRVDVELGPCFEWDSIVARIETEYRGKSNVERELREQLVRSKIDVTKLQVEIQDLKKDIGGLSANKKSLEVNVENLHTTMRDLVDQNSSLQSKIRYMESQLAESEKKRATMVASPEPRDRGDKINVIHNVSLKVDDKLEKLHVLISDLAQTSRIMIDANNNIVTDHPFVEKDMLDVRRDLEDLNKLNDEAKQAGRSTGLQKPFNITLGNLNLKANARPNPDLLKKYNGQAPAASQTATQATGGGISSFRKNQSIKEQSEPIRTKKTRELDNSGHLGGESAPDDASSGRMSLIKSRGFEETPRKSHHLLNAGWGGSGIMNSSSQTRQKTTQTDPLEFDSFLASMDELRQTLVRQIVSLNLDTEGLLQVSDILKKISNQEASNKRNIIFINKLLDNENIGLLQDATNEGEVIQKELVMYIKRIQNPDMLGNKVEIAEQVLEKNRMTKDDSMATKHLLGKGRAKGGLNAAQTPRANHQGVEIIQEMTQNPESLRLAIEELENPNPQLKAYQEKYIEEIKKGDLSPAKKQKKNFSTFQGHLPGDQTVRLSKERKQKQQKGIEFIENSVATDEETIMKLYEYLTKSRGYNRKYYKYPFKSVEKIEADIKSGTIGGKIPTYGGNYETLPGANELINISSFDHFKKRFLEIVQIHKVCGDKICPHLRRFYQRIGFNPFTPEPDLEIHLPRFVIDRIVLGQLNDFIEPVPPRQTSNEPNKTSTTYRT